MSSVFWLVWDHPRMRGEHPSPLTGLFSCAGSSPHARGTPIPALAWIIMVWDHPRMRGEHSDRYHGYLPHEGSSPHARGTLRMAVEVIPEFGIIPACAGNTVR